MSGKKQKNSKGFKGKRKVGTPILIIMKMVRATSMMHGRLGEGTNRVAGQMEVV